VASRARPDSLEPRNLLRNDGESTLGVAHAVEPLAPEWDALADRVQAPPFVRPGWISAWWRAFGNGDLEIFTLRQRGLLVGLLPLCRFRGALRSPTNWHTPGFGLLAEPDISPEFMQQILLNSGRARRISLGFVDPSSADIEAWRSVAEAQRFRVLTRTQVRSAFVELNDDWDAYQAGLSRNLRGGVRRSLRRLREAGTVSFEIVDGREGLDLLLTEGFRIESSGWKAARGTAILSRSEIEGFYREVGAWAAQKGWLRLAFLRLDNRALAFEFAIEDGGVLYALKSGFDPVYRAFSPGKLLIHKTVKHASSAGLVRYELATVEEYKLAWANAFRNLVLFQAFASSPAGLVDWAAFIYGRPLAKRAMGAVRWSRASAPGHFLA
jgi:CelD/BcsL family acetyltransferase involved in cellulose biosynthesis